MATLTIDLDERGYPIIIEAGCLAVIGDYLSKNAIGRRYAVIADSNVSGLYGHVLLHSLKSAGIEAELLVFPQGEASKNLQTLGDLAGRLARHGFDRHDALIALGGGVTGDLTGFLASTYMRGVPFIGVPTSLLAQVDSSVGGKTGVDIPEGKNLVGTFYQPAAVFIDLSLLTTLPRQEMLGGMAEVVKYGVIRDPEFFSMLRDKRQEILDLDQAILEEVVTTCCRIKAEVVSLDEREGGLRRILNYGHTIGHAVEAASEYATIHGFAVSIGMVAAARVAHLAGMLDGGSVASIRKLLVDYGLPVEIPKHLDCRRMKTYLLADKKTVGGRVHFVLPTAIGATRIVADVDDAIIERVLAWPDQDATGEI
jgi:3-dehydroquinate synthase